MDITNKKYLYAVGCSHMAGSEVIEFGNTARTHESIKYAWPGLLAEHYGLHYINDSEPGGSNEYMVRSVMHFVNKWLSQDRDPSELLVVIGWTTDERIEFTHENNGIMEHFHWANGCDWRPFYKDGKGPKFENWFKALQLYHTDFDFGRIKRVINITLIDAFLKSNNIDYIQVNNCAKMDKGQWEFLNIEHMVKTFPFDTFIEPYDSFVDQYKETHKEHFSDWLHADKHVHNLYFKKLKQRLDND